MSAFDRNMVLMFETRMLRQFGLMVRNGIRVSERESDWEFVRFTVTQSTVWNLQDEVVIPLGR